MKDDKLVRGLNALFSFFLKPVYFGMRVLFVAQLACLLAKG